LRSPPFERVVEGVGVLEALTEPEAPDEPAPVLLGTVTTTVEVGTPEALVAVVCMVVAVVEALAEEAVVVVVAVVEAVEVSVVVEVLVPVVVAEDELEAGPV
jgi:hypothetical protein